MLHKTLASYFHALKG